MQGVNLLANVIFPADDGICEQDCHDDDDNYLNYVHLPADVIFTTDEVARKENHRLQLNHQLLIKLGSF